MDSWRYEIIDNLSSLNPSMSVQIEVWKLFLIGIIDTLWLCANYLKLKLLTDDDDIM